ncbi:MAG: zinc ABC transporter substrate-binding protein [bacterium]|nr:zinc ABC transporter substrate-binding protein [bacterium]
MQLFLLASLMLGAGGGTRVVATLPDLADLANRIGGDRVDVTSLARPGQNLHAVRVKPSHLVAVSRADVFLQVGLSLEHAWVPGLLETARNRDVSPGGKGFVNAGEDFETIDVPQRLDRSEAVDVHPQGNPHVNQSFEGGRYMAARILAGLERVDPGGAKAYRANHAAWLADYEAARTRWEIIATAVAAKGDSVCVYHREFDYLLRDVGLEVAISLEPKPGIAPTPAHLANVVKTCRERGVRVIVTAPWSNNKSVASVAKATGAEVLELPLVLGDGRKHASWIAMIDDTVGRLARAVGVDPDAVVREHAAKEPSAAGGGGGGGKAR